MRGRRSRLHDFKDANGETIGYPTLIAVTGLTQSALQNRLRVYESPPTDIQAFVKTALEFRTHSEFVQAVKGAEFTEAQTTETEKQSIKVQLDQVELQIKEQKLRQIAFENDKTEGKYALLSDVQLALDNFLITLKTNLEALPEQVAQSIMVCREEHEAIDVLLEALKNLTRDIGSKAIEITQRATDAETDDG